jgi:hypothetical protein
MEKARKKKDRRTFVMVTLPAVYAPACEDHINIVKHQPVFYGCGCEYKEGEKTCPSHHLPLGSVSKMRLSARTKKPTVIGGDSKSAA